MKDTYECLWSVYTRRKWADQELRLYGGEKRTFVKFFDRMRAAIGKDKTLKVSDGSAKFGFGGQGRFACQRIVPSKNARVGSTRVSRKSFVRRWPTTKRSQSWKGVGDSIQNERSEACNGAVPPTKRNASSSIGITTPRSTS